VQREILLNVARFEGYDDFVHDICDKSPFWYGEKGSKWRKACLSKRQGLIDLQLKDHIKFLDLCKSFGLLIQEITKETVEVLQQSSPTVSINKATQLEQKEVEQNYNSTNNTIKINSISKIMEPKAKCASNGLLALLFLFLLLLLLSVSNFLFVVVYRIVLSSTADMNNTRSDGEKIQISLLPCGTSLW
jgi:hypothetical protein